MICGWDEIDRVVTDDRLTDEWRSRMQATGAELILAPVMEPVAGGGG